MEEQTRDILERLESLVQSWTSEVDAAQRRLGEQLTETRHRIQVTAEGGTESLRAALAEQFSGLQRLLEECAGAIRDIVTRVDALENEVASIKGAAPREGEPPQALPAQEESPPGPVASPAEERTRKVKIHPFDEQGAPRRMGEILVDAGLLSHEQLETALEVQRRDPQRKLGSILVERGFTGEEVVPQVLARQLRLPYIRLKDASFDPGAVGLVTGRLAARHACIPLRATTDTIALAMANPLDLIAIEDTQHATGRRVQPLVARESEIMDAITRWYGPDAGGE